ncbi:dehydrogenase, selenocysteine-containing [Carboxydothermus islandicus]|uniref:Dehydrogenase, selenocysteine-containing n=1 Tax=Carboxydothermus islandicus TaxID=661089 RepID=A0A1L8D5J8_9THEO|nr:dehydrogenase, selenocysteine-containing [Carboxydothermus islandicus]
MANANIRAEVIEVSEFPELGDKYNVFGVPKSVINETVEIEGAAPEIMFVQKVLEAVQ